MIFAAGMPKFLRENRQLLLEFKKYGVYKKYAVYSTTYIINLKAFALIKIADILYIYEEKM